MPPLTWTRDNYQISTDPSLIPLDELNQLFDSHDFHWGKSLPDQELERMVRNSLCFVLYEIATLPSTSTEPQALHQSRPSRQNKLIGFSRWIWDGVTVAYLTDVYISPEHRGKRLGVWMMKCIDETFRSLPHIRGMILIADRGSRTEALYRQHLSMDDLEDPGFLMDRKGRGAAR